MGYQVFIRKYFERGSVFHIFPASSFLIESIEERYDSLDEGKLPCLTVHEDDILDFFYCFFCENIPPRKSFDRASEAFQQRVLFDNYDDNIYTYDDIRHMAALLRQMADIMEKDGSNPSLGLMKKNLTSYDLADYGSPDYREWERREYKAAKQSGDYQTTIKRWEREWVDSHLSVAVDFYRRFADALEWLMKEAPDFDLICFSGS